MPRLILASGSLVAVTEASASPVPSPSSDADVAAEKSSLVAVDELSPLATPSPVISTVELLSTEPSLFVAEELVVVTGVVLPSPSVLVDVEVEKLLDVPPLELLLLEILLLLELLLVLVLVLELMLVVALLELPELELLQLLQPPQLQPPHPAWAAGAPKNSAASAADANNFFMVYLPTPFEVPQTY